MLFPNVGQVANLCFSRKSIFPEVLWTITLCLYARIFILWNVLRVLTGYPSCPCLCNWEIYCRLFSLKNSSPLLSQPKAPSGRGSVVNDNIFPQAVMCSLRTGCGEGWAPVTGYGGGYRKMGWWCGHVNWCLPPWLWEAWRVPVFSSVHSCIHPTHPWHVCVLTLRKNYKYLWMRLSSSD